VAAPPRIKPLPGIDHVVVLMLENRSFDNVLGGLYGDLTQRGLYRGLRGTETNPLDPANPKGGSVTVFQGPAASPTWYLPYPDPGELYSDMVQQIFGSNSSVLPSGVMPPMSGFAWNYTKQPAAPSGSGWPEVLPVAGDIMQYYSGATMPISSCLAQGYAVCDCWFAAAPVQTIANRILAHCGTPSRQPPPNEYCSRINNPDYVTTIKKTLAPPVDDTTIFELLDKRWPEGKAPDCSYTQPSTYPLNWKVYYHDAPLSALCKYVYEKWCQLPYLYGGNVFYFYEYEGLGSETNFEYDIANGLLPKYSFIEPRYSNFFYGTVNSNHPGGAGIDWDNYNDASLPPPVDVRDGDRLLWQVFSILARYPSVFEKTLLIVTYDEHGGLFDHVAPPPAKSPFTGRIDNFPYDRYGVRVPAILINPRIPPKTIYPLRQAPGPVPNPPYDHTSILSTLMAQFDVPGSMSPRVDCAPLLSGLVTETMYAAPVCPPLPPALEATPAVAPPGPRPLVTVIPAEATNLRGALAWLYQVIQTAHLNQGR
jgi:phospholipase C